MGKSVCVSAFVHPVSVFAFFSIFTYILKQKAFAVPQSTHPSIYLSILINQSLDQFTVCINTAIYVGLVGFLTAQCSYREAEFSMVLPEAIHQGLIAGPVSLRPASFKPGSRVLGQPPVCHGPGPGSSPPSALK